MPHANQRIGEYVLQERVGGGAFGEVWRAAHHVWADRVVAVKVPTDPQFLRNLQREGLAVHGLEHPNVVRAMGFDPYADPPYLVTEFVPGRNLRAVIKAGPSTPADAAAILRQVLAGLQHAHGRGIVHRDIKPENILVHERAGSAGYGEEGVVKVTDFGLGRARAEAGLSAVGGAGSIAFSQSLAGEAGREIAGTLDYMAPEQRAGAAVDGRADVYACGAVLFELLTGERPAGTDVPSDLNPAVPASLDEAFRRSFARLERRFASAAEFAAALESASPAPAGLVAPPPPVVGSTAGSMAGPASRQLRACPHCSRAVAAGDQFCMHCGRQLSAAVRRCGKCGAFPDPSDRFCLFCGDQLTVTA